MQWEYQVGPCLGIDAGDQLIVSRYLSALLRHWCIVLAFTGLVHVSVLLTPARFCRSVSRL